MLNLRFLFGFVFFFLLVFSFSVVSSNAILSEPSMCCERNVNGVWCINEPSEKCDDSFKMAPSSCEYTSYCRLGTCYDSSEGICYENTPQRVCDDNGGTWDSRKLAEVPQCQLGCCIIADQAAFVPLVRCKKLSTYFGVESDYRKDVENEMACIVLANSQDMGACVYEKDYERVCEFTTRGECGADESVESINFEDQTSSARKFYKDYLCSAEELNTVCARQAITGCYQGKVYWYDSCGNRENVYASDRDASWNNGKRLDPDEICAPNDGSNPDCGNCEYMLGSRCEEKYGLLSGDQAFCQKTECTDRWGGKRLNGESWCVNDGMSGNALDKVGSRYYREVCTDGEIRVEPCADYRNEICYETDMATSKGAYTVAACRVNRWQACIGISDKNQCLNKDKRDCTWLPSPLGLMIGGEGSTSANGVSGYSNPTSGGTSATGSTSSGLGGSTSTTLSSNPADTSGSAFTGNAVVPVTGDSIFGEDKKAENETTNTNREYGVCVPEFAPGLKFWDASSESVCNLVTARCVVQYKRGAFGDWECTDNCECLDSEWALEMNRVCTAQGDCGAYINYIGKFTDSGYEWLTPDGKRAFKGGDENYIRGGFGTAEATYDDFGGKGSLSKELMEMLK